jgi:DNA polymerase
MGAGPLFLDDTDRADLLAAARELLSAHRGGHSPGLDELRAAMGGGERAEVGAAGTGTSPGELPVVPADYAELRERALGCTRCGLAEGRTQVVFADGVVDARVVVVGEAPGANEDRTGLPFVGAAGKLLDLMLASVDLSRERNAYICNVLKCRPPGNRNPLPAEIEACAPYLKRQLQLVSPEVLLAVGTFAAQWLTGSRKPLGKLRGDVHSYEGVPVVVTYHPAALLRNRGWTRASWDDLQLLRQVMEGR